MYVADKNEVMQNNIVIARTLNPSSAIRIADALNNNSELSFRPMGTIESVCANGSFVGLVQKGHWLKPL